MTEAKEPGPKEHAAFRLENLTYSYGPNAPPEVSGPEAKSVYFSGVVDFLTQVRGVVTNLLFFGAVVVLVLIVVHELQTKRLTIGPIHIPDALKAGGYSEDVLASRLRDAIGDIQTAAATLKDRTPVSPSSASIDIVVPEIGVSLNSVMQFVRSFLGIFDTTVTGEVICEEPTSTTKHSQRIKPTSQTAPPSLTTACRGDRLALRLRISSAASQIIDVGAIGSKSEKEYLAAAAESVLRQIDPYVVAAFYSDKDPDKALQLGEELVAENHRDSKWALLLIGLVHKKREEFALAREAYQTALRIDPNFAMAYNNLGALTIDENFKKDAATKRDSIAAAIAEYQRGTILGPQYALIHRNLAYQLSVEGLDDGARVEYEKAIALEPSNAKQHSDLAKLLAKDGRYDDALLQAEEAADLEAGSAVGLWPLAMKAAASGDTNTATLAARAYLSRSGDGVGADDMVDLLARLRDSRFWHR